MSRKKKPALIVTFVLENAEHDQMDWEDFEKTVDAYMSEIEATAYIVNILQAKDVEMVERISVHYEAGKGVKIERK